MSAVVLELRDLRVEVNGRCLLDKTSLSSSGERIGLLAAGKHVLAALRGDAKVTAGKILISGVDSEQAQRTHLYALAVPWPSPERRRSALTIREGLLLSAMLAGAEKDEAERRVNAAFERLGMGALAGQRLSQRVGLEHYLSGLLEAEVFDPQVVVVEWPIGALSAEGWVRYGTVLSQVLTRRRWLVWVPGPARLAVEQAWVGALDQLLYLDGSVAAGIAPGQASIVRTLLVLDALPAQVQQWVDTSGLVLSQAGLSGVNGAAHTAFVVELPRDEFGRPCTETVLAWCDQHQLPIVRLEPLEGVC